MNKQEIKLLFVICFAEVEKAEENQKKSAYPFFLGHSSRVKNGEIYKKAAILGIQKKIRIA